MCERKNPRILTTPFLGAKLQTSNPKNSSTSVIALTSVGISIHHKPQEPQAVEIRREGWIHVGLL